MSFTILRSIRIQHFVIQIRLVQFMQPPQKFERPHFGMVKDTGL